MKKINNQDIEDLTLLLAYLTSWDEDPQRNFGTNSSLRAWKGYDFEILDSLQQQEFIDKSHKAKSVYLTNKGIERAQQLFDKFFGDHEK